MDQGWVVFWAIVAILGGALWYLGHCRFRPYASCLRCDGRGQFRSPSGRTWRHCPRCRGSGSRVRVGRRAWDKLVIAKDKLIG